MGGDGRKVCFKGRWWWDGLGLDLDFHRMDNYRAVLRAVLRAARRQTDISSRSSVFDICTV